MKGAMKHISDNWEGIPCPLKAIKVIKITESGSGISGMIMVKNPISKKLRDKIVREWNKAPNLIICHDHK